jgi:hypothetical protein
MDIARNINNICKYRYIHSVNWQYFSDQGTGSLTMTCFSISFPASMSTGFTIGFSKRWYEEATDRTTEEICISLLIKEIFYQSAI